MTNVNITVTPTEVLPEPYYQAYIWRFWRPLIGGLVFDFIVTLQHFQNRGHEPSIKEIVQTMAYGTRHTILGREATTGSNGREGLIDIASKTGLVVHTVREGDGRWVNPHQFVVAEKFPILTPKQVNKLPSALQDEHNAFVRDMQSEINAAVFERLFGVEKQVGLR